MHVFHFSSIYGTWKDFLLSSTTVYCHFLSFKEVPYDKKIYFSRESERNKPTGLDLARFLKKNLPELEHLRYFSLSFCIYFDKTFD